MVTIQFREFGVRLTFTPTITPRGTIHLEVAPEVSALDFTNGLSVSGFIVPALTTRKLNTQVELSEGQSFAIGGTSRQSDNRDSREDSFHRRHPGLGKAFPVQIRYQAKHGADCHCDARAVRRFPRVSPWLT